MRYGYAGKLLKIDLKGPAVSIHELESDYCRKYLGGNGFGAHLLLSELMPGTDPLGEDNILLFTTGPLNGTPVPMASKFCVVSKSPLTETFMDGFSSGRFGAELKYAGFDILLIEGIADNPVYIFIDDETVHIRPAAHLRGMDTLSTQTQIRRELGMTDIPVLSTGPAGENQVRYACIITENRAVGSGGLGAVMGSKKLKAIAVRGNQGIRVHDHTRLFEFARGMKERIIKEPAGQALSTYGTSSLTMVLQHLGGLPTYNWQKGRFTASDALSAESLMDNYVSNNLACFACMTPCGHYATVKTGPYKGAATNGPEFQSIGVFGSLIGNNRLDAVIQADRLCDELGLGQISAGVCIAFAMECYERGLLTRTDLDGLDLKFGNHEAMIEMLRKIAYRQGVGDILAQGVKRAAAIIGNGAEQYAIHVKGMEMSCFCPRILKSQALGFAVSSKGPSHNEVRISAECGRMMPEMVLENRMGYLAKELMDWSAIANSLIWCLSAERLLNITLSDKVSEMLHFVTGFDIDQSELTQIAARIHHMERLFNIREGFKKEDDTLPDRFFDGSVTEGQSAGAKVERKKLESDILDFYRAMGWDEKGNPRKSRLKKLGLASLGAAGHNRTRYRLTNI